MKVSNSSSHSVGRLPERSMHPLLRAVARDQDLWFDSCLDIGCGRSRYDSWFDRFERSLPEARYIGLETDPEILRELQAAGVDARHAGDAGECRSDLVLCIEVIEHLRPDETPDFMRFVVDNTAKLMILTTPNFEYWDGMRQKPEYRECRWIPDHFPTFNLQGGPHHHKQAMTPENLSAYFEDAFLAPEWDYRIFRAWPWRLQDEVTGEAFQWYFKLFGVAWRRPQAVAESQL